MPGPGLDGEAEVNQTWAQPTGAHGLENTCIVLAVRLEEHRFL